MLRLTDWSNQDQMMVLYAFGNLTELIPCQVVFNRPFIIKENVIKFFLCSQFWTCSKAGIRTVVAR